MTGKPRVSPDKINDHLGLTLFIDWQLFWALVATSETKQNIKQAVIEAKRVADQLQVMAGQLDRLANQILRQARKQFKCENNVQFREQY